VSDENAADTTNTQSLVDDQAVYIENQAGSSVIFNATYVSFDANGWTLNYGVTEGTANKWIAFAIEEDVAGAVSIPVMYHYRSRVF
jgi:hypothetical protein